MRRLSALCALRTAATLPSRWMASVSAAAASPKQQKPKRKTQRPLDSAGAREVEALPTAAAVTDAASPGPLISSEDSATTVPRRQVSCGYPSFSKTVSARVIKSKFAQLAPDERAVSGGLPTRVAGRIVSIRDMGKVVFITIRSNNEPFQIAVNVGDHFTAEGLAKLKEQLRAGDIVGAEGVVGRTKRGELSIFATSVELIAPFVCTDMSVCPDLRGHSTAGLADADIKYRYRFVDLMTDPSSIETFRLRAKIVGALRQFLNDRDFVEVETPMFHQVPCGANAKPFVTHHNANNSDLFLRIAPELYLKQLVVGGMERVYEIGRVFRNEDSDKTHNPEFTSCEFYAAYCDYKDLMDMSEELLRHLAAAAGSTTIAVASCVSNEPTLIDLSKPFRRVSVLDEIERKCGVKLPPATELDSPRGFAFMAAIMLQHGIQFPSVRTAAKMLDKLIDHFITDEAVEPVFVMDHPLFMSPLAKEHKSKNGLSERFELFINGMEVANSYSELNDPHEQLRRFEQQLKDKALGDDEAMPLDETFLKALQVGLPPTAGWGMGIDRIVMLLSGARTIRDVIMFPLLRDDVAGTKDGKRKLKAASFFDVNSKMAMFCLSSLEAEAARRGDAVSVDAVRCLKGSVLRADAKRQQLLQTVFDPPTISGAAPCSMVWQAVLRICCRCNK
jgi:lysyl-tRNA synthetase class 2